MDINLLNERISYFFKKAKKAKTIDVLYEYLDITTIEDKKAVNLIIKDKILNYEIIETTLDKFIDINKTTFRKGRFIENIYGGVVYVDHFYVNKDGEEVYYETKHKIDRENLNGAIDGDIVLIDIISNDERKHYDCKVIDIIDRDLKSIAGEVYKEGNSYYLKPLERSKKNLVILLDDNDSYVEKEKVLVKLNKTTESNFYTGKLVKRIGHKDDPDSDILFEAYKNGIEVEFSKEAVEQSENIPCSVSDVDKINRMDLTDKIIFTIDGDDTKDIDDAISLEVLDNGNYLLGVHIADPAYYIEENSYLDKEASSRGTSVYLANKVIPMIPHKLSNGICSLNPNVERLTQSCFMEIDKSGRVVNYNIGRSVIKSRIKMTYKNVNKILKEGIISDGYEEYVEILNNMRNLSEILRGNRNEKGALEIDRSEVKLIFDEDENIISIDKRHQDIGERIIEEFMLCANETICKHLISNGLPSVNRIHEEPSVEKINEFIKLLKITGNPYSVNMIDKTDCKVIQKIYEFISNIENNEMQQLQFLKSLKRAKYSFTKLGHSGLAKEYYCHFTSPMRRYPDLIQNRILSDFIYNNPTEKERKELIKKWRHKLPEITSNSSRKEKMADECERDVLLMKCCEYIQKFKGQQFIGTIIDMDDNCLYVQLDNMIEGKVRPRNFSGRYFYNSDTYSMISLEGNDDYYLGDRLLLELLDANKEKKLIDFKIIEKLNENKNSMKKENEKAKIRKKQMYFNSNKGRR